MKCTTSQYVARAAHILGRIQYATLATVTESGQPWNSPVFAVREGLRWYWISDKESQHSRNIAHNGQVFIVLYDSTVPEGQGEGVYIQAIAHEVTDEDEIRRVRILKKGEGFGDPYPFMGSAIRRVYVAVPEAMWMNADQTEKGVFIRDYRVPLPLAVVCRLLGH